MKDSPYLQDKSEREQFLKCQQQSVFIQNYLRNNVIRSLGYYPTEVTAMIQKLRAKNYSDDYKVIEKEAIRRCQRWF